jgi:16S rRNA (guanine966-N2)-methyltransferase
VRVIAGTAKGTRLGRVPAGVRPVSDRVREGLFSSLGPGVTGTRILDLYAGTGAVGIEALSRGAEHATFVDDASRAVVAVRENLRRTGFEDRSTVHRSDVLSFLRRSVGRMGEESPGFDLVFLDPPYDLGAADLDPVLVHLSENSQLREGFTVVLSRGSRSSNHVIPLHWHATRRLSYGDSVVTLFRSPGTPGTPASPATPGS